jgi:hypothetical protein
MMLYLKYFAFVGAALVTLMFVADATLQKGPPPVVSSSLYGLPKPWKPDPQTLAATPAPAPDMSSEAVLAATPKPGPQKLASETVLAATPKPEPPKIAKVEAPKKKKHVAARRPIPDQARQSFAWRNDSNPFGGGGFFGRF